MTYLKVKQKRNKKSFSLTDEQQKFIRENYKNKTRKELSEYIGCTPRMIKRLVAKYNIRKNNAEPLKIGDIFENLEVIQEQFLSFEPNGKVKTSRVKCRCLLCNREHVVRVNGLRRGENKSCGCNKKANMYRKYSVNNKFFDVWSADMAYIMGFITADGNVYGPHLRISLQSRDIEILEYIKEKLDYTGPICNRTLKQVYKGETKYHYQKVLDICAYKITDKLRQYGICESKTGKEILPDIPDEYFFDYLRGFFDGDGCIYHVNKCGRKYIRMTFSCSNNVYLEQLKEKCNNIGSIHKCSDDRKCFVWVVAYHGSLFLGEKFYSSGYFALDRKKSKWLNGYENYHSKCTK